MEISIYISTYNIYYDNNSNTSDSSGNNSIFTQPKIARLVSVIRNIYHVHVSKALLCQQYLYQNSLASFKFQTRI